MSHDAATGYMTSTSHTTKSQSNNGLARRYTQTVTGTFYEQLDNGARALDIRPLLLNNGTIVFQHGVIRIDTVDVYTAMSHVLQWCGDHPNELVLLLPSHFAYQNSNVVSFSSSSRTTQSTTDGGSINGVDDDAMLNDEALAYYEDRAEYDEESGREEDDDNDKTDTSLFDALKSAFQTLGIPVYECTDIYQWTVGDAMKAGRLAHGGYALALMSQSGTSCAKENWLADQIVTCYPSSNSKTSCTHSDKPWQLLQQYLLSSANNPATDDTSQLGPPADLYHTPLFELQALWQVDAHAVVAGMAHWSSILIDDRQSRLHEKLLRMLYESDDSSSFQSISLLAVDNIALHGNAITSVLRNRCGGQLADDTLPCGTNVPPPRLYSAVHVTPEQWLALAVSFYMIWFAYSVVFLRRPKLLYTAIARWREKRGSAVTDIIIGEEDPRREDLLKAPP
jgi:hypothetical protein